MLALTAEHLHLQVVEPDGTHAERLARLDLCAVHYDKLPEFRFLDQIEAKREFGALSPMPKLPPQL